MSQQIKAYLRLRDFRYVGILSAFLLICDAHAEDGAALQFGAANLLDAVANTAGGIARGGRLVDNLDLTASYAPADGVLSDWSAFADVQLASGGDVSGTLVGDMQGAVSTDQPPGIRLIGAWVARSFAGVAALKAGIVDLNSEFDAPQTSALFFNGSQGIGIDFAQSGANGPSITPATGLGLVGAWLAGGHWQLKAGLFEGAPGDPAHPSRTSLSLGGSEGVLAVAEIEQRFAPHSFVRAGGWLYTADFATLDGKSSHGNAGAYATLDARLLSAPGNDEQGLSVWLRIGTANARINPVALYIGAGAVYTGVFAEGDQIGVAVAAARMGDHVRAASGLGGGETALELTYSAVIAGWLSIQPDLQYVVSPGADPALANALVVGTRFSLTWN